LIKKNIISAHLFFYLIRFFNIFKKIDLFEVGSRGEDFAKDFEKYLKVHKVDANIKNKKIKKAAFFSKSGSKNLYIYKNNASLYKINNDFLISKKKIKVKTINNYILNTCKNFFAIALDCEGANLDILKPLIKSKIKKDYY